MLLALAYGLAPGVLDDEAGIDPDAVHDALADLGHPVPPIVPSAIWAHPTPEDPLQPRHSLK